MTDNEHFSCSLRSQSMNLRCPHRRSNVTGRFLMIRKRKQTHLLSLRSLTMSGVSCLAAQEPMIDTRKEERENEWYQRVQRR